MSLTPSSLLAIVVTGVVGSIVCWPAQRVEARASSRSVFTKASLPGDDALAALRPGASRFGPVQQQDAPLPDGKGKDLALKYCTTCHAANVWSRQHHTPDQWNSLVDQMVSKGLTAPDDDLATISDYLAANFGPLKKDGESAPAAPPPAR